MENSYFESAKKKASRLLHDKPGLRGLLGKAGEKVAAGKLNVASVASKVKIFIRMVRAYISGNYRLVPWKTIILITAVLIYFVMPLDLIADFIPVTGYLDDISLILWAFGSLEDDINAFIVWEQGRLGKKINS